MVSPSCFHDKSSAHRLLAAVILDDLLLDAFLQVDAKVFHNRQVHPRIHQHKRISSGGHAVEAFKGFEGAQKNFDIGHVFGDPTNLVRRVLAPRCDYEAHVIIDEPGKTSAWPE